MNGRGGSERETKVHRLSTSQRYIALETEHAAPVGEIAIYS